MGILADPKNKILFVAPHKGGQCTISTWIESNMKGQDVPVGYYKNWMIKDRWVNIGQTLPLPKDHNHYTKILVLRDPYKKFISGFLQDSTSSRRHVYCQYAGTFLDYCRELHRHYLDLDIKSYAYGWDKSWINNNAIRFSVHLLPMTCELEQCLSAYDFDFIVSTEELNELLEKINELKDINGQIVVGNKKSYCDSDIDIINTPVKNIANGCKYPPYHQFYNEEIKQIVREIYKEDFDLCAKYGITVNEPI